MLATALLGASMPGYTETGTRVEPGTGLLVDLVDGAYALTPESLRGKPSGGCHGRASPSVTS